MKTMKYLSMMLVILAMSVCMTSCSSDDEEPSSLADQIAGDYVGTLKPVGYTDEPARSYVTLTRKANDVVSFECSCETFDLDLPSVNLKITDQSGVKYLTSESSRTITGTATGNSISITFATGNDIKWFFAGTKQ